MILNAPEATTVAAVIKQLQAAPGSRATLQFGSRIRVYSNDAGKQRIYVLKTGPIVKEEWHVDLARFVEAYRIEAPR